MTKVLVIEDENALLEEILDMLRLENFTAVGAPNGLVGVALARQHLPDLILCDVIMPELDGFGVLQELRRDSITATIPFIFLTARAEREAMRKGMELGADDYLTKPFMQAELLAAIRTRLDKHAAIETQRLRTLSHRLMQMQEVERYQVARELSDETGQMLAALQMILETTKGAATDANRAKINQAQDLLNQLMTRIGDLSFALRPVILDDLGLLPVLVQYFERYTAQTLIDVHFRHAGLEQRFQPEAETAVFRIIQEALTNVARHTRVREVEVHVWAAQDTLYLQIEDRGGGFDLESTLTRGIATGLTRMHGRAALLGGYLNIESKQGGGTRVLASLPATQIPKHTPTMPEFDQPVEMLSVHDQEDEKGIRGLREVPLRGTESATRIVLADSYDLIRQGMRSLLEAEPGFVVVGEATEGWKAVELVKQLKPNVLIVDFALPKMNGIDVTRSTLECSPQTRVLILSIYSGEAYVLEALKCGATGYVLKHSDAGDLVQAVREVSAGRRYLSPALSERAIDAYVRLQRAQDPGLGAHDPLTNREHEIVRLVAEGYTSAEIAKQLSISPRTAETHRANIMRKLGLRNQVELVRYALQHGLVSTDGS
jgi:two-component system response regulator NreC